MLSFVLKDVEKEFGDDLTILKVDFDQNKDLTAEYGVIRLSDSRSVKRWRRGWTFTGSSAEAGYHQAREGSSVTASNL